MGRGYSWVYTLLWVCYLLEVILHFFYTFPLIPPNPYRHCTFHSGTKTITVQRQSMQSTLEIIMKCKRKTISKKGAGGHKRLFSCPLGSVVCSAPLRYFLTLTLLTAVLSWAADTKPLPGVWSAAPHLPATKAPHRSLVATLRSLLSSLTKQGGSREVLPIWGFFL